MFCKKMPSISLGLFLSKDDHLKRSSVPKSIIHKVVTIFITNKEHIFFWHKYTNKERRNKIVVDFFLIICTKIDFHYNFFKCFLKSTQKKLKNLLKILKIQKNALKAK